jgi:hypothetical protein
MTTRVCAPHLFLHTPEAQQSHAILFNSHRPLVLAVKEVTELSLYENMLLML